MAEGGLPVRVVTEPNAGARGIRVREVVGGLPVAVVDGIAGPSGMPVVVITDDGSPGPAPIPVTAVSGSFGPATPPVAGYSLWLPSDGNKWQDVAGTIAASADGDPVGRWDDYSGSATHALQPTAGMRPLLKKALYNAKDALRYDGADDWSLVTTTNPAARTDFVIVKKRSAAIAANQHAFMRGTGNGRLLTNSAAGSPNMFYYSDEVPNFVDLLSLPTNLALYVLRYASTASATVRVNGGAGLTFDPGDSYQGGTELNIASTSTGIQPGDFDVTELLSYPSALSLANINSVGPALATKFGLVWTTAT